MRFRVLATLAAGAALLAIAAPAAAHNVKHDADFDQTFFTTTISPGTGWETWGRVKVVTAERCEANRVVRLVGRFNGNPRVLDSARTSRNGHVGFGYEGGAGEANSLERLTVKLLRKRVGPKNADHRHICAPHSQTYLSQAM